jgi:K+-sensing histidine kinase KdpD
MSQVLVNLVKYALNYARGERIQILANYDHAHFKLKVTVIHCGKGLTQSELDKLRSNLLDSSGDGAQDTQEDSNILGLVLCRKIVQQYEG